MQAKLDQEKTARQSAESAKLEMEKKKNELLVDLDQIRSESSKLAQELKSADTITHTPLLSKSACYILRIICDVVVLMQENMDVKRNMEQEVQRRNMAQTELKSQIQEIQAVRVAEKQSSKVGY